MILARLVYAAAPASLPENSALFQIVGQASPPVTGVSTFSSQGGADSMRAGRLSWCRSERRLPEPRNHSGGGLIHSGERLFNGVLSPHRSLWCLLAEGGARETRL